MPVRISQAREKGRLLARHLALEGVARVLLVVTVAVGLVFGWLRGGRLGNLLRLEVRGFWLPLVALLFKYLLENLAGRGVALGWGSVLALHLGSYLLLAAFVWANRSWPGIPMIALGLLANALVVLANQGAMPVLVNGLSPELVAVLSEGRSYTHTLMQGQTPLAWLGDWLLVPFPARRVSPGDLVMLSGVAVLLQGVMRQWRPALGEEESPTKAFKANL